MTNQTKNNNLNYSIDQHLLKSIDCLYYRLKMITIEHRFQSIIHQIFQQKTLMC